MLTSSRLVCHRLRRDPVVGPTNIMIVSGSSCEPFSDSEPTRCFPRESWHPALLAAGCNQRGML